MKRRRKHRNRYQFTDSSIAIDTIIAFLMAGISMIIELAAIINAIASKGHIHDIFGNLFIAAIILSLEGMLFAWFGMQDQKGGIKGKRISLAINGLAFSILVAFFISGLV